MFAPEKLVFSLPPFDVNNYFTSEVLSFLFMIAAIVLGILLCFFGHRFMFTFIMIGIGIVAGVFGIRIVSHFLKDPILQMFFFVTFIFLTECLLFGIHTLIEKAVKKARLRRFTTTMMVIITSILGFLSMFLSLYFYVYRGALEMGILCLLVAIAGFVFQRRKKLMKREFFTYDDIYYDSGR